MVTNSASNNEAFLAVLRTELLKRCEKNPAYSLRAFAKQMGVSHPSLSQVLLGKRPLTTKSKQKMALALGVRWNEMFSSVAEQRDFHERFSNIDLDSYELVSDWYHDAILEMTRLPHFKGDPKWIAKTLGLNVNQVNSAVHRLEKAGFLEIKKNARWKDLSPNNTNNKNENVTTAALKKYQIDLLNKSAESVEFVPRDLRDHTSLMFNVSSKDIKRCKDLIRKFRLEISKINALSKHEKDNLYALQISLFPLTQTKTKAEEKS